MGGIEGWARIVLWWLLGMPLHSSSFNINRVNINRTTARPHPRRCGGVPKRVSAMSVAVDPAFSFGAQDADFRSLISP